MFALLSAEIWRLRPSIGAERQQRLLDTTFDEIVVQITANARIASCATVRSNEHPDYERVEIAIELPATVVDLFHNGAGGYRAQYYESLVAGEQANRHVIDALQELSRLDSGMASKSIRHGLAKIWIREGRWRDDNLEQDRNLEVKRWQNFAARHRTIPKLEPIWASLTPNRETYLEIKGAWVHKATRYVLDLKPSRSQTLHNWGFT